MDWNGATIARELSFSSNLMSILSQRAAFLEHPKGNWHHLPEQEEELRKFSAGGLDEDAIVLGYSGSRFGDVSLNLWQTESGYELTGALSNSGRAIVPIEIYDLIEDLKVSMIDPFAEKHGVSVVLGSDVRDLTSLSSKSATIAFEAFETSETEREKSHKWDLFIVQSFESGQPLSPEILSQRLIDGSGLSKSAALAWVEKYLSGLRLLEVHQSR